MKVIEILLRFFVGLVLLVTAVGKLLDNRGFSFILIRYAPFPSDWVLGLALSISLAELVLAIWLFSGMNRKLACLAALIMHLAYLVWTTAAVERGLEIENCGCFGVFWARPPGWGTVIEDAVMVAVCSALRWIVAKPASLTMPAAN